MQNSTIASDGAHWCIEREYEAPEEKFQICFKECNDSD